MENANSENGTTGNTVLKRNKLLHDSSEKGKGAIPKVQTLKKDNSEKVSSENMTTPKRKHLKKHSSEKDKSEK